MGASASTPCSCSRTGVARLLGQRPDEGDPQTSCTLRIIQITDVYTLENFPHLRTLIMEKRKELEGQRGGKTISMLTGDFLAPYLLSSLDRGVGMMQMCNGTPIDYLTWGNHEDDVGHADVLKREREYKGVWINTNMQSHESFPHSKCQVDQATVEIQSRDGSNKRKVSMLGLLSNSPSLYKPHAFGGAKIEDVWETLKVYKKRMEDKGVDMVLPLCHLYEPQDERTCREFDVPLVLSGHDHHVVDRTIEGTRLLKPGLDGHKAWKIDITWPSAHATAPVITADLLTVKDWPADEELKKVADKAYSVLDPLRHTQLARISQQYRPLTSFNSRGTRVSMGTYMLSRIRDALNMNDPVGGEMSCDVALLKGGNVRGGRDYADDEHLTLEILQSELEETKIVVVVPVPGLVLKYGLRETWAAPNPGFMQCDDGVEVDDELFVTHVGGEPIDLTRVYKVASISDFWRKRDAPTIGAYFELHPELLPEPDAGIPMHALLVRFFSMEIWIRIWRSLRVNWEEGTIDEQAFQSMDHDGDGKLSKDDIRKSIENIAGLETFTGQDIIVDQMFSEISQFARRSSVDSGDEAINKDTLGNAVKHWSTSSLASASVAGDSDQDDLDEEIAEMERNRQAT